MNGMIYHADIKRPSKAPSAGGREGMPDMVIPEWPCSIVSSGGREVVIAQQVNPLITHVAIGINPGKEITAQDYLEVDGRRLNVDFVDRTANYGAKIKIRCIEQQ